ncbi:Asp-tRNA(Asn)/Glu-tRNA(Gln) amidotransferase subunit GatC [Mycoplasmopsis lipofaciens]|uniref:Asp-tRNA(Asn)/Glu-tRNA(Gln) amidotransferase subunit GatC n=1 Tax=Mycoplasmopsis lipofaciens TaxID=114884 RepID=UPI0004836166|nr:aspartyl/glutamyl-tRNA amidotransferase subunit C [Mycoplasmopsis lipofaciens]
MKEITKDKLKQIVLSLMIEPTDEVLESIMNEWHEIQKELELLNKIDLTGIKPLTHIDETYHVDFLREDEIDDSFSISKTQILENAFNKDEDYLITKKVVK